MANGPGKFEGEPDYAPYLWEQALEGGDAETYDNETLTTLIVVTPDDVAKFPELAGVECVALWESDQGFVFTHEMTRAEWDTFEAECAAQYESEAE